MRPSGRVNAFFTVAADSRRMSKAIALTRSTLRHGTDFARLAIVLACAGALILAGEALPLSL